MAMYEDEQGTGLDETYDDTEQVGTYLILPFTGYHDLPGVQL